jgi:hypothetical protein
LRSLEFSIDALQLLEFFLGKFFEGHFFLEDFVCYFGLGGYSLKYLELCSELVGGRL